jgi:putative acetyltransferase
MANGEIFQIAAAEGAIVGFCGFKLGVICGLFVDPDYMRRGVASQLLSYALSWMSDQKCQRVEIEATLTAVPFYQRHGFQVVATKSSATRGGLDMSLVDMERQLTPLPISNEATPQIKTGH